MFLKKYYLHNELFTWTGVLGNANTEDTFNISFC